MTIFKHRPEIFEVVLGQI